MRAFTLIELLVVMGIVGLLLVMAVGAYQGIGRAAQVETAVTQLKFTMQLTRQWAITNRQTTWMVFPTTTSNNEVTHPGISDPVATNVNYRAYGIYAETPDGPEMIREWSFLAPGIFFDPRNLRNVSDVSDVNLLRLREKWGSYMVPSSGWPSSIASQPAFAFRPSGSLFQETRSTFDVYISEGFWAPENPHPTLADPDVIHAIRLYRFTGLPQITRYGEDDL